MPEQYLLLRDLLSYRIYLQMSEKCWEIYEKLDWKDKKVLGDQFITAIDSIGANIAEGYGRYHFLDRIKFYYNSRGSLLESKHWTLLLKKRGKITDDEYISLIKDLSDLHIKLNSLIKASYTQRDLDKNRQ